MLVSQKRIADIALDASVQNPLHKMIEHQTSSLQKTMALIALRPSPFEKAAESMALQAAAFQKDVLRSQTASWRAIENMHASRASSVLGALSDIGRMNRLLMPALDTSAFRRAVISPAELATSLASISESNQLTVTREEVRIVRDAIPPEDWMEEYDQLISDAGLKDASRSLYADGYYSFAVQDACTYYELRVKELSGVEEIYGADLMHTVFSVKKPILRLNEVRTLTDRSEQQGLMELSAGIISLFRNPKAHALGNIHTRRQALQILGTIDNALGMLTRAKRA